MKVEVLSQMKSETEGDKAAGTVGLLEKGVWLKVVSEGESLKVDLLGLRVGEIVGEVSGDG